MKTSKKYLETIKQLIEDNRSEMFDHIAELDADAANLYDLKLEAMTTHPEVWDETLRNMQDYATKIQKALTTIKQETKKYRVYF